MKPIPDPPRRILIVEDEVATAFDIEDMLRAAGLVPLGPALTVAEASRIVDEGDVHAAIVDAGMVDGGGEEILSRMTTAGVPYLFVTGHRGAELPPALRRADTVLKPFHAPDLLDSLSTLLYADAEG
jgi:DNA-binding response OmpR family regulator